LQILLISAILVISAGFYFNVTKSEWIILILCCGMVMSLELANSSFERLCDLYTTEFNPKIKYVKDVMAGAVLIASIMAFIIGIIIFYPYFKLLLS
jgi:diacylglycerol kinase